MDRSGRSRRANGAVTFTAASVTAVEQGVLSPHDIGPLGLTKGYEVVPAEQAAHVHDGHPRPLSMIRHGSRCNTKSRQRLLRLRHGTVGPPPEPAPVDVAPPFA
jgi:hypothetical protein